METSAVAVVGWCWGGWAEEERFVLDSFGEEGFCLVRWVGVGEELVGYVLFWGCHGGFIGFCGLVGRW